MLKKSFKKPRARSFPDQELLGPERNRKRFHFAVMVQGKQMKYVNTLHLCRPASCKNILGILAETSHFSSLWFCHVGWLDPDADTEAELVQCSDIYSVQAEL